MKILQINVTYKTGGSTGRIVFDLRQLMSQNGIENYVTYGIEGSVEDSHDVRCIQSNLELKISQLQSRLFSRHGFYNVLATKRLITFISDINPDIIHLHNIHGFYVHCGMLFSYIKEKQIPVVWTLHDCWSFTGWCAYFDYSKCNKWRTHCFDCPSKKDYPKAWITSRARSNYELKKNTFTGVKNLVLVTPSQWLADLTRESFLRNYPVRVINNGVNLDAFKPKSNNIKEKLGISDKKMILAVAGGLAKRKGRDYLLKLPSMLTDKECLVILGINADQQSLLPKTRCIGIPYTNSVESLAEIYSAADVFINTTLEDNFPTTNLEALACGTPVITFETGGSVEPILNLESFVSEGNLKKSNVGGVVPKGDIDSMVYLLREYYSYKELKGTNVCVEKVFKNYNSTTQYQKYIDLYKEILDSIG